MREPEEQAETGNHAVVDIPEVDWEPIHGQAGFVVIEGEIPVVPAPERPILLAQGEDVKKHPPPIIDFDPPNPPNGKDKKPAPAPAPPALPAAPAPSAVPPVAQPGPRPLLPFGMRQARLPLLGDPALALAKMAPPTKAEIDQLNQYVKGVADPRHALELIQGRARLLMLKAAPKRIQVAADGVITCTLSGASDIAIVGNQVGTTVLNLWFASADDQSKEVVLSYAVRVAPDPEAKNRVERAFKALEGEIGQSFPGSQVQLKLVGDAIVIAGKAPDRREADLIRQVVAANMPEDDKTRPSLSAARARVINLLHVPAALPVPAIFPVAVSAPMRMPEGEVKTTPVKLWQELASEINRAFPDSQIQLSVIGDMVLVSGHACQRREAAQLLSIVAANTQRISGSAFAQNVKVLDRLRVGGAEQTVLKVVIAEVNRNAASRATACFDLTRQTTCMDKKAAVEMLYTLKHLHCAITLAEPNLVTLDGATAKFEAAANPLGVQLAVTPTVLDKERMRLEVSASLGTGAGMPAHGFSSTVEIGVGQTLAVAGLIQATVAAHRVPFLRGAIEEKEIVILITPEWMHEQPQASAQK